MCNPEEQKLCAEQVSLLKALPGLINEELQKHQQKIDELLKYTEKDWKQIPLGELDASIELSREENPDDLGLKMLQAEVMWDMALSEDEGEEESGQ